MELSLNFHLDVINFVGRHLVNEEHSEIIFVYFKQKTCKWFFSVFIVVKLILLDSGESNFRLLN
jgi:hypothetical protein